MFPNFNHDQSKDFVFQISSDDPHGHQEDMKQVQGQMPGGSNPSHNNKKLGKGKQQHHMILANSDNNEANIPSGGHDNCEGKIMRRDNERQRRQHMAVLNASLRSLLPLQFIQGKRSISDHMNEAVNYINHMKRKIHELNAMREKIKRLYEYEAGAQDVHLENESNNITVRPTCLGGVEVVMSSSCSEEEGFSLSGVLKLLLEQGLMVVDCASTRVNERLFHTIIQCEVDDLACIDLPELQLKLDYCRNSE